MPQLFTIVGGGPGALAPLFAAASAGLLRDLLSRGVTVLEKTQAFGAGNLCDITINSDSAAEAFLDILATSQEPDLLALLQHPIAQQVAQSRGSCIALPLASQLLQLASGVLLDIVRRQPGCRVLSGHEVLSVKRLGPHLWEVLARDTSGTVHTTLSTSVHLATGAHQPIARLKKELVAGEPLLPRYADKLVQTGELFTAKGAAQVSERLAGKPDQRVVIVGGSTSAGAAAVHLLQRTKIQFAPAGLTLMHRSPLRLFYASIDEAHADGYDDFRPEDVCPISGRVFRLGGFRFESKNLLRDALLPNGRTPDSRLRLFSMQGRDEEARQLLAEADLIIAAIGYVPRMCNVLDERDRLISLREPRSGDWSMVDQTSTVLTREGVPLPGLTAMGLAVGPAASRDLGGEANFRGQVNSLWLWQNRLGRQIVESALRRGEQQRIPLLRPSPPRLSEHATELQKLEQSNIYSNFGPINTQFEQELVNTLFDGDGGCVTTCNATLALMIAIKNAVGEDIHRRRFALMPSFTFPAAAQAALWCGLTPLFCDIDPHTWLPCHESELSLLDQFKDQVAVIVPNATFGNNLDLDWYADLQQSWKIPVVVDAAASFGSLDSKGQSFGKGSGLPIVFSMHATKCFSTGEGGVIYSSDMDLLHRLRAMASFGFGASRVATMPGLNAKLSEVAALTASLQLKSFPQQIVERQQISSWYETALHPQFARQKLRGQRQVRSFQSILLPQQAAPSREAIRAQLSEWGVMTGTYFSPHLAQQEYLRNRAECPNLPVSDEVAQRILSLPHSIGMSHEEVTWIADALEQAVNARCPHTAVSIRSFETASDIFRRAS